jgi:hypothetical protein
VFPAFGFAALANLSRYFGIARQVSGILRGQRAQPIAHHRNLPGACRTCSQSLIASSQHLNTMPHADLGRAGTGACCNVALRMPAAAIPRAVVKRFGLLIAATSANLRGASECTDADCVLDQIGDLVPLIVNGGPTGHTLLTTIVDLTQGEGRWKILRECTISTQKIVAVMRR